ncbi:hypothetical protein J7438_12525 [Thalassotalea sp. G20_0]|uniref:hypothetical protein n=1 Tax=Thalassotalea sp. G20_0 TaxID=2821093 RepID=UPI001ADA0AA3|nr:hypothetical protein [Thalassotalea sp. G20_0]MBO9494902.1 hypothetical protein [Thalassotalea sp. G20_0]
MLTYQLEQVSGRKFPSVSGFSRFLSSVNERLADGFLKLVEMMNHSLWADLDIQAIENAVV